MLAEQKVKIKIPQDRYLSRDTAYEVLEVDESRIVGDPNFGIRFEITEDTLEEFSHIFTDRERKAVENGAQIFIDETDNFLILNPEEPEE